MLKQKGKAVTYNDVLKFSRQIGLAIIEELQAILKKYLIINFVQHKAPEALGNGYRLTANSFLKWVALSLRAYLAQRRGGAEKGLTAFWLGFCPKSIRVMS